MALISFSHLVLECNTFATLSSLWKQLYLCKIPWRQSLHIDRNQNDFEGLWMLDTIFSFYINTFQIEFDFPVFLWTFEGKVDHYFIQALSFDCVFLIIQ